MKGDDEMKVSELLFKLLICLLLIILGLWVTALDKEVRHLRRHIMLHQAVEEIEPLQDAH